MGNSIYNKKMELVRTIPKKADLGGKDPDNIIELCNEVQICKMKSLLPMNPSVYLCM